MVEVGIFTASFIPPPRHLSGPHSIHSLIFCLFLMFPCSLTLFLSNEIVVVHLMMSARYFIDYFFFLGQMTESALGKTIIIKTKTETTNRI